MPVVSERHTVRVATVRSAVGTETKSTRKLLIEQPSLVVLAAGGRWPLTGVLLLDPLTVDPDALSVIPTRTWVPVGQGHRRKGHLIGASRPLPPCRQHPNSR
jgi:hypothetical protein